MAVDPSIMHGPSGEVPVSGYDPTTKHAVVPLKVVNVVQDATTGQWYGELSVDVEVSVSPTSNQRVSSQSGDFAAGSIADLATLLTQFAELLTDTDNLAGLATQTTLAAILAKLVSTPALEGGNLATLAGVVSASKAAVKAGAGDFADLATIAAAITAAKMQSNTALIGGQAPTLDNTSIQAVSMRGKGAGTAGDTALLLDALGQMTIEQFIQYQIMQGHGFRATTGMVATGASNAFIGMQLISNNVGKHVLIYNIVVASGSAVNAGDARLYESNANTADAGLTGTAPTAVNQQPASATASVVQLKASPASSTETTGFVGTLCGEAAIATDSIVNMLPPPSMVYFNTTDVGSVSAYVKVSASGNNGGVTMDWIEW